MSTFSRIRRPPDYDLSYGPSLSDSYGSEDAYDDYETSSQTANYSESLSRTNIHRSTPGPWKTEYVPWGQMDSDDTLYSTDHREDLDSPRKSFIHQQISNVALPEQTHVHQRREFHRDVAKTSVEAIRLIPPEQHRELSVSPPTPPPRSPSPAYLRTSEAPSIVLGRPEESRKLLVLDLNGTLLIRAPHSRHKPPGGSRLRTSHPRPYMPTLRAFLFSKATRAWLDVMIWSSAQPHSVKDMVNVCFKEEKKNLLAVWARDTLGLSKDDYSRKATTTKDLAKPWAFFLEAKNRGSSPLRKSPRDESTTEFSEDNVTSLSSDSGDWIEHSAKTTLLLDDSPLKARVQPYNHVCVKEYDQVLRNHDLEWIRRNHRNVRNSPRPVIGASQGRERSCSPITGPSVENYVRDSGPSALDETLLAVIGILNTIKTQSNVAGWIRSGGLWGPIWPPELDVLPGDLSNVEKAELILSEGQSLATEENIKAKPRRRNRKGKDGGDVAMQTGNDAQSTVSELAIDNYASMHDSSSQTASEANLWFESSEVLAFWAGEGRRAAQELGVDIVHGVDR